MSDADSVGGEEIYVRVNRFETTMNMGITAHILVGHSGLYQLTVYLTEFPRRPLDFAMQRNR